MILTRTSVRPRIALVGDAAPPPCDGQKKEWRWHWKIDAWTLGQLAQQKAATAEANEDNALLTPQRWQIKNEKDNGLPGHEGVSESNRVPVAAYSSSSE